MKTLSHTNVVRLFDAQRIRGHLYLVLEFCSGDTLENFMAKTKLPEKSIKYITTQLVDGLHYLHRQNIAHRDLKPANILLQKTDNYLKTEMDFHVKIADFTFARLMEPGEYMNTILGTPLYMAPEIFLEKKYTDNSDLWSLGIITYQMLYGKLPFIPGGGFPDLIRMLQTAPSYPQSTASPLIVSFVQSLLEKDPKKRLSWKALLDHPFLAPNEEEEKQYQALVSEFEERRQTLSATKSKVDAVQAQLDQLSVLRARVEALRAEKENIRELKLTQESRLAQLSHDIENAQSEIASKRVSRG